MRFVLLAALAASTATPALAAPQEEMTVLILSGAKSKRAAQAKHADTVAALATPIALGQVQLAPGYPKLIESATVEGLNPGFFITIAGYCSAVVATPPSQLLRVAVPGSYTREVKVVDDESCPRMGFRRDALRGRFVLIGRGACLAHGEDYDVEEQLDVCSLELRSDGTCTYASEAVIGDAIENAHGSGTYTVDTAKRVIELDVAAATSAVVDGSAYTPREYLEMMNGRQPTAAEVRAFEKEMAAEKRVRIRATVPFDNVLLTLISEARPFYQLPEELSGELASRGEKGEVFLVRQP